ncbi:MarR family transcriptional regulator [Cryobacterium sp. Hh7]|uniref:MarR family winged helix-turn-helix transcriptional regulator n=1 Tax=Cryobacterium sp. Hh7 TaxID=1259159 RepID=UPI00106B9E28|nr:MarR family winged helix-turn-helix transcriptional regulator [Cryobacterium sp. Hh7]TFD59660.1 MarR family transcriptional regulator [Cryobacterium sp. Hh7]
MTGLEIASHPFENKVNMASGPHFPATELAPASEIITEPLDDVIDTESFTPRLLALISTALVRRESRLLLRDFSLGTNDWRVLSALAGHPAATATEISDFLAVNKAVISKSVNLLIARDLIVPTDGPRGSHPLYLTRAGARMHDAMKPISLGGQDILLAGLTADEVAQLNAMLGRILLAMPMLDSDVGAPQVETQSY